MKDKIRFPQAMRDQRRWLVRKCRPGKDNKEPCSPLATCPDDYVPGPPRNGKSEGPSYWRWRWNQSCVWVSFGEAVKYLKDNRQDTEGLSFVLHPAGDLACQERIICIDFDGAFGPDGKPWPWVEEILVGADSFVEYSRSGNGLHLFLKVTCEPFINLNQQQHEQGGGIEVKCNSQIAVTGRCYEGELREIATVPQSFLERLPFFKFRPVVSAESVDASELWSQKFEGFSPAAEDLIPAMETWTRAIRDDDDGCDSHGVLLAAACHLARHGITGHEAVELLKLTPVDEPWAESDLERKVGEAYKLTNADGSFGNGPATGFDNVSESPKAEAYNSEEELILTRLQDVKPRDVEWLVDNRIPLEEVTYFFGREQLGKSFLLAHIAACVSTGRPCFPDDTPKRPRSVLMLVAEDDLATTLRVRLQAMEADLSKVFVLEGVRIKNKDGKTKERGITLQDIDRLDKAAAMIDDLGASLIDPWGSHVGDANENSQTEVRELLAPYRAFAKRHKIAAAFLAHSTTKPAGNSKNVNGRVLGSSAIVQYPRAGIFISDNPNAPTEGNMAIAQAKLNIGTKPQTYAAKIVPTEVTYEGKVFKTGRLEFDGTIDYTANELAAWEPGKKTSGESAFDTATGFIMSSLPFDRPVLSKDLETAAKHEGISPSTFKRARAKLGSTGESTSPMDVVTWYRTGQHLTGFRELHGQGVPIHRTFGGQALIDWILNKAPTPGRCDADEVADYGGLDAFKTKKAAQTALAALGDEGVGEWGEELEAFTINRETAEAALALSVLAEPTTEGAQHENEEIPIDDATLSVSAKNDSPITLET